jgi:hypothetical protein
MHVVRRSNAAKARMKITRARRCAIRNTASAAGFRRTKDAHRNPSSLLMLSCWHFAPLAMADGSSALLPDALPVLLAHAAAMRAVGERTATAVVTAQQPSTTGEPLNALPEALAHALSNAVAAHDAARARATLACVCSDARAAADAAFPASQRHGDAARARTCKAIAAALQYRSAVMLPHCAPALHRLCTAAEPPPATMQPADAWQQFLLRVQPATEWLHDDASSDPGDSGDNDAPDDDEGVPDLVDEPADAAGVQPSGAANAWHQLCLRVLTATKLVQEQSARTMVSLWDHHT